MILQLGILFHLIMGNCFLLSIRIMTKAQLSDVLNKAKEPSGTIIVIQLIHLDNMEIPIMDKALIGNHFQAIMILWIV